MVNGSLRRVFCSLQVIGRVVFYGCSLINKIRIGSQLSRAASGMGLLILIGMPPFLGFLAKVLVFLMRGKACDRSMHHRISH